jgi:lipopolysaccharide export system protein LptA
MIRSFRLLLLLSLAAPASAQIFRDHDSNAPVQLDAGRGEVQDRADRAVFSGGVHITQGGMKLDAERVTIAYTRARGTGEAINPDINRIDASGNVVVVKGDQVARGSVAIYDLDRRIITMLGNVQLTQGANRLNGGRLVIDLDSGRATVDGRSSSPSAPGTAAGSGRVTGTFTVPQRAGPQ